MSFLDNSTITAIPYLSSTSSSSSSPSSFSSNFSPLNKQQKQNNSPSNSDDHYDTPWEFKNRTLAAILENQRFEQQNKLNNNEFKNNKNSLKQIEFNNSCQNNKLIILNSSNEKKLNLQFNNNNKELKNKEIKQKQQKAPPLPIHQNNNNLKIPLLSNINSNLNNKNFIKINDQQKQQKPFLEKREKNNKFISSSSSSFIKKEYNNNNLKRNEEENNNQQLSTNITKITTEKQQQRSAPARSNNNNKYPLVNLTKNNISNNINKDLCQEKQFNEEDKLNNNNLIHENMERAEAELLLGGMPLGSHLLRRRPDKSLALSLKANEGVLHIKLEYRCDRWVLGEGPRFNKIIEMLKAYRKVELPVRGAEQIRLSVLFRPGDMPGNGLLLL